VEENVIKIEDNVPIKRNSKYSEYFDILYKMKPGQSFLTDNYRVVDEVRHRAWEEKIPVCYRSIKETGKPLQYRIWRK
jgi:hypothetical protein